MPPSQHYAAIGFSFTDEEKAGGPPKKANPIGSLEALQTSQEHTKTVLGESNAELSHLVKNVSLAVKKKLSAPGTRGAATVLKRIGTLMVSGVMMVVTAVSKLGANIFLGKKGAGTGGDFVPRRSGEGLTREKKALAIGVLACFLVGGILLYGTRGKGDKAKSETAFTDTVTQIEERLLSADSSLIYRNTEEARTDLVEAASLLETLPRDTAAHKTKADELGAKIAELEDKTRGITTVSPQTLATLEGGSPFTAVTEVSGRVYAFSENLDIYRLESLTSSFVKEEATKGILETVKTAVGEGANAIVLDLNKQIGRADFTAKTLNPLTSGTNDMLSVEDIVSYNGNIYALSSGSAQIVKMRPQGNVYEAGTAWITSVDSDLSQARALAIDGDIYILTTHDVVKLRSGKEIDWPHATIDPELKNPTDIWTDVTSKYLYILDPGESRILVMNKESGATEAQYTAPEIANAIGFTIEENANRILFFTKNQAFAFTADHLVR